MPEWIVSLSLDSATIRKASPLSRWQRPAVEVAIILCLLLTIGCGGSSGPRHVTVSGEITVDGKSMEAGTIRFLPIETNKGPAVSGLIQGGSFRLSGDSGPIPGPYRVLVTLSLIPPGGKMISTTTEVPRNEWEQVTSVPDQAAFEQSFSLSANDPP